MIDFVFYLSLVYDLHLHHCIFDLSLGHRTFDLSLGHCAFDLSLGHSLFCSILTVAWLYFYNVGLLSLAAEQGGDGCWSGFDLVLCGIPSLPQCYHTKPQNLHVHGRRRQAPKAVQVFSVGLRRILTHIVVHWNSHVLHQMSATKMHCGI